MITPETTLPGSCRVSPVQFIAKGELLRVPGDGGGFRIECRSGKVWITQEGDPRDLVLERGEAAETEGHGLVLVESLCPALVRVTPLDALPTPDFLD
ncbi:MAG: DUF2917 domain-containing protein [Chthoniobacteraceae bacterium]